jgi:hypothetical protein
VSELKNLRTRLIIASVSVISTAGALLVLLKPFMGGIKGLHEGDL